MISYYENDPTPSTIVDLNNIPGSQRLTDTSPMPFGKHKDRCMEDVPAHYLHWFFTECRANNLNSQRVVAYIKDNLSALREEFQDGIWQRPAALDS